MLIACPHCQALNRVPDERLGEDPNCGQCKAALLPGTPVELGDANFAAVTGRSEIPVLVDFWAPWCGPCRTMAPQFEAAARELKGRVLFAKVNSDDNSKTSVRFRIRSIPTLLLLHKGEELKRVSGAMPARELVRWVTATA